MIEIGSIIDGKYKVLNEIGHGGMSTVYLAINEKANKPWAIKEVRKAEMRNFEIVRQSLLVETDLLKKLSHPNLPSIVDIIDQDEDFLIVMDYIEGNTLEKVISERGYINQDEVVKWALQLCDVLDYLHTRTPAIIYRDMKPSNIMLKSDGSVVLIDFGTAREYKNNKLSDTTCLGTQGYAAPEQFGGMGQTDARTDIYCLGATLYHLLTGHNPSESPYEMYPITYWNSNLSTGLENIIIKCTQKDPMLRYQTAKELMYDLQHYRDLDKGAMKKYRRRMRIFAITGVIAIVNLFLSFGLRTAATSLKRNTYNEMLEYANKAPDDTEAFEMYTQAIAIDPTRAEAYTGIYDRITLDGVFDEEEERRILKLNASTEKYLQSFRENNSAEFGDFSYNIGNAYWFYYVHEESRQSHATAWFDSAREIYYGIPEKEMEYKRSSLFVEIGSFYKKVLSAQIEGTDRGMYGAYWNQLVAMKRLNDVNPDRDLITLRMYREIVTRSIEYAKYLCDDGIAKEDIADMYKEIIQDMNKMETYAVGNVQEEIVRIKGLISNADNMLDSSYR